MKIESLKLKNFRNYDEINIIPSPDLNLFIGKNAQGKTNIMESIALSILGSSFRTNRAIDFIKMDRDISNIFSEIKKDGMLYKRSIEINNNGLNYFINGKKKSLREFSKDFAVVIFRPDDLYMIKASPSERRKYIDEVISNIDLTYRYNLNSYKKLLMERNKVLKSKNPELLLDIYDAQIAKYASEILIKRLNVIKILENYAKEYYHLLSGSEFKITYLSTVSLKKTKEELTCEFRDSLKRNLKKDMNRLSTTIGPHRDDLDFKIDGKSVKNFGSQGEIRSSILSLKLSELKYIINILNTTPVLLLDDVMSELDNIRRDSLLNSIEGIQTFITSTHSLHNFNFKSDMKVFMIESGTYKEIK